MSDAAPEGGELVLADGTFAFPEEIPARQSRTYDLPHPPLHLEAGPMQVPGEG
jgi:hypothetical protein